ncbi:MAG: hypothetical protein ACYDAY_00760 [Candidatus Dormibacteria bacterium]
MKICESCLHHRRIPGDTVPIGVSPENRRTTPVGETFYLFCSYFHSYPSASARVSCAHYKVPLTEDSREQTVTRPIG